MTDNVVPFPGGEPENPTKDESRRLHPSSKGRLHAVPDLLDSAPEDGQILPDLQTPEEAAELQRANRLSEALHRLFDLIWHGEHRES